ncbi:MAG: hypothetical protein K9W44_11905 [Candidatus Lokiarchaeota archaeon]|nr:hypothetical protein [Candidatus Harpocratesius repetitus]
MERAIGLSESSADSDSDGLSDGDEVILYNTDPNKSDTDRDGFIDGIDPDPSKFLIPTGYIIGILLVLALSIFAVRIQRKIKKKM